MAFNPVFKGLKILETKNFRVEQDWEIPIPGFFVVAPIKKVVSITDFTEEQSIELIKIIRKVRNGMRDVLGVDNVYLFQSEINPHDFHVWMFPRYDWMTDEKFGREIIAVRPAMNYARDNMMDEKTISKVKEAVEKMKKYMSDF